MASPVDVRGRLPGVAHRLPGGLCPGWHRAVVCGRWHPHRHLFSLRPDVCAQPAVRDHREQHPDGGTAVRVHGGNAGKIPGGGKAAVQHGPAVRPVTRRHGAGDHPGGRPARRQHRYRWCHGGDHGPALATHHAAPGLPAAAVHRADLRHWHPGADYSALHCAGVAGRCAGQRLPGRPAQTGPVVAGHRVGGGLVCRGADSRPDSGGAVPALCGGDQPVETPVGTGLRGH